MAISNMNQGRAMRGPPRTPASWNLKIPSGTEIKLKDGSTVVTRGRAYFLGSGKMVIPVGGSRKHVGIDDVAQ